MPVYNNDPLIELLQRYGRPPLQTLDPNNPLPGGSGGYSGTVVRADEYRPEQMFPVMKSVPVGGYGGGTNMIVRETDPAKIAANLNLLRRQIAANGGGGGRFNNLILGDTIGGAQGHLLDLRRMNLEAEAAAAKRQADAEQANLARQAQVMLEREKLRSTESIAHDKAQNVLDALLYRGALGGAPGIGGGGAGTGFGLGGTRGTGKDTTLGDFEESLAKSIIGAGTSPYQPPELNTLRRTVMPQIAEQTAQQQIEWDRYMAQLTRSANEIARGQGSVLPTVDPETGDVQFKPLGRNPKAGAATQAYADVFRASQGTPVVGGTPMSLAEWRDNLLKQKHLLSMGHANALADIEALDKSSGGSRIDPAAVQEALRWMQVAEAKRGTGGYGGVPARAAYGYGPGGANPLNPLERAGGPPTLYSRPGGPPMTMPNRIERAGGPPTLNVPQAYGNISPTRPGAVPLSTRGAPPSTPVSPNQFAQVQAELQTARARGDQLQELVVLGKMGMTPKQLAAYARYSPRPFGIFPEDRMKIKTLYGLPMEVIEAMIQRDQELRGSGQFNNQPAGPEGDVLDQLRRLVGAS